MGLLRFLVPRRERLAQDAVERAYMAGMDEIPWHARIAWTDEGLSVERAESDSGNFYFPCPVAGHGELTLSTASLMERYKPYHLHVELARGTLNRLRNQMAGWEQLGLSLPESVRAQAASASEHLSLAATRPDDEEGTSDRALAAIGATLQAIDSLTAFYVAQALAARHQQVGKFNTLMGINLGSTCPSEAVSTPIVSAFNTAVIPFDWREIEAQEGRRDWSLCDAQIEWCKARSIKICGGPLVQLDRWSLPDWMYLWGGDEEGFRACIGEHIEAVVTRYRGKVQLWLCAARLNVNNDFARGEEQRLRLAVLAVERIRRVDPRTPIVLLLDQPWGSFMSRQPHDLSPLHFADALVRADLGLAGIGLEINLGYAPRGSEPRDTLEFSRQIDRFSTLGLPLLISLTVPSSGTSDPQAQVNERIVAYAGDELSPEGERAWAEKFLPLLLAKQSVQGLIWNQLLDSQKHSFPHGGLFDASDRPKPIVGLLQVLRQQHVV